MHQINIFEFFGLKPDHRNHAFQKVKDFYEVPESKVAFPLVGQEKIDGVFAAVCVNQNRYMSVFGRSGRELSNVSPDVCGRFDFKDFLPGVYISEIFNRNFTLEQLSGVVNPDRVNDLDESLKKDHESYTSFYFHDMLTINEFIQGSSSRNYISRYNSLIENVVGWNVIPYIKICNIKEAEAYFQLMIKNKKEGIVLKRNVDYLSGHKGWRSMKMVGEISYDLRCTGYEIGKDGTKREGQICKLKFIWKDGMEVVADLGKGWTDEDRIRITGNKSEVLNSIYRVYAKQLSSKGRLRQPKVGEKRIDKRVADFE